MKRTKDIDRLMKQLDSKIVSLMKDTHQSLLTRGHDFDEAMIEVAATVLTNPIAASAVAMGRQQPSEDEVDRIYKKFFETIAELPERQRGRR